MSDDQPTTPSPSDSPASSGEILPDRPPETAHHGDDDGDDQGEPGPSQPIFVAAIAIAIIAAIIAIVAIVQSADAKDELDEANARIEATEKDSRQTRALARAIAEASGIRIEDLEAELESVTEGQQSAQELASELGRQLEAASDAGDDALVVANLQAELKVLGYYDDPITGVYDDATTEAVARLQSDLGLEPTGTFDQATADALNEALGRADAQTSEAVSALQEGLAELGYYSGPITGVYDDATTEAVAQLQSDLGLEPTGDLDQRTAFELGRALGEGSLTTTTTSG